MINKDIVIPIQRIDLLSLITMIITMNSGGNTPMILPVGPDGVLTVDPVEIGDAERVALANAPVKKVVFTSDPYLGTKSWQMYLVPTYDSEIFSEQYLNFHDREAMNPGNVYSVETAINTDTKYVCRTAEVTGDAGTFTLQFEVDENAGGGDDPINGDDVLI